MKENYNLTHGMSFDANGSRFDLLVAPSDVDDQHELSLWFAAQSGEVVVRVLGPDGDVISTWHGTRGEQRLRRHLKAGKYAVEVNGAAGEGVVGVKGPAIGRCTIESSRLSEHPAEPSKGFYWPYLLVAPKAKRPMALLVLPNNSGFISEDIDLLRASALCEARGELDLADHLGTAVLVPLFPRPAAEGSPDNLYLQALARAALTTTVPRYARVDLQLIHMIDAATALLPHGVGSRVLLEGFSAAGMFSNRFAVLHPDRTLAVASGSPGGWPLAPLAAPEMDYPVGVADVAQLIGRSIDLAALRKVSFFFFLGGQDANDSLPNRDSFSAADEAMVMRRFGKTPVDRWDAAKRLYAQAGLRAAFKLYPGIGHTISPEMHKDIEEFFRSALR